MLVVVEDSLLKDIASSMRDVAEEGEAAQNELDTLRAKQAESEKVYLQKVASASRLSDSEVEELQDVLAENFTRGNIKLARETSQRLKDPRELVKFAVSLLRMAGPRREGSAAPLSKAASASHRYSDSGGLPMFGGG